MTLRERPALPPGSHDLAVSLALATLPRPVIAALVRRLTALLPRRHPALAKRLAELEGKSLLIVPDELSYGFHMSFPRGEPRLELIDPDEAPETDAQMRGPLRVFYDLARGGRDGDALFFSRELNVTGDMTATVTLRNAMDGAGVDLFSDFIDMPGPLGVVARGAGLLVDRTAGILLGPLAGRAAKLEQEVSSLRAEIRRLKDAAPRAKPARATPNASLGAVLGVKR